MLIDYLPERYQNGSETMEIVQSMEPEIKKMKAAYEDFLLQLHVHTATYGLIFWENLYGIFPDNTKSIEERRQKIFSKMRAVGTTTPEVIRKIAQSFYTGLVSVTENFQSYSFQIDFKGAFPMPHRDQITTAIHPIKPAHLGVNLGFEMLEKQMTVYAGGGAYTGISQTTLPEIEIDYDFEDRLYFGGAMTRINYSVLPEL